MKIVNYDLRMQEDRRAILVAEYMTDYMPKDGSENLNMPQKVTEMICAVFDADKLCEEKTWVVAYDSGMNVLGVFCLGGGLACACYVDPSAVFTRLLLLGAKSFVFVHNHPGGTRQPSDSDKEMTERLKECGELLGCPLLDHIIIVGGRGKEEFFSFNETRLI